MQPRQYAVIPMDKFLQQSNSSPVRREIETTHMDDVNVLDAKIRAILDDRSPGADSATRAKMLRALMYRFVSANQAAKRPVTFPILSEKDPPVAAADAPVADENPMARFPGHEWVMGEIENNTNQKYAKHGKYILRSLFNAPNFGWNEKREIVFDGKTVPGSNITSLVNDAVKQAPTRGSRPLVVGWREFGQVLRENAIPEQYIGFKDRYLRQQMPTLDPFYALPQPPPPGVAASFDSGEDDGAVAGPSSALDRSMMAGPSLFPPRQQGTPRRPPPRSSARESKSTKDRDSGTFDFGRYPSGAQHKPRQSPYSSAWNRSY